jgi:starch synthase (maltosyl-transferring)
VFSEARRLHDRNDVVVADLDPHTACDTWIYLHMPALGVNWHERCIGHDPITSEHWNSAEHDFVRLGRDTEPMHVIHVERERHETSPC